MQSSTPSPSLRIGTRGSPLALAQAREVRARLAAAHGLAPGARSRSRSSAPRGDRIQDRPLAEVGGKGLFTKEIEEALLAGAHRPRRAFGQGHADRAAGRARDRGVPAARGSARRLHQPQGRDAARAAAGRGGRHRVAAPPGAGQAAAARSRGGARCAAMSRRGCASSTTARSTRRLLALAGLKRLGLRRRRDRDLLDVDEFLPAVGQGDHRDRDARRRRAHARAARADQRSRRRHGARVRARVSRGARRLLPHADRRPRHASRAGALRVSRPDRQARRQRGVRDRARRRGRATRRRSAPMPAAS